MDSFREIKKIQKSLEKLQLEARQLRKDNRAYKRTSKLIVSVQKQYEDHIAKMKQEQINMERIRNEEKLNAEKLNEERLNEEQRSKKENVFKTQLTTSSNYMSPLQVLYSVLGLTFLQYCDSINVIDIIVQILLIVLVSFILYKFKVSVESK